MVPPEFKETVSLARMKKNKISQTTTMRNRDNANKNKSKAELEEYE